MLGFLEDKLNTIDPKRSDKRSLSDELDRVREKAIAIWNDVQLSWYTDHGISHSNRIIDHIGNIVTPLYQNKPNLFSKDDLFILLSACYLHDIGMQYLFAEKKNRNELTPEDYEEIRKKHPEVSAEHIKNQALVPCNYINAVCWVAKAHGTEYFKKAIAELIQDRPAPNNEPICGGILASLLMIGDELDLHHIRVSDAECFKDTPRYTLPADSLLHIYKHHYIAQIEITSSHPSKIGFSIHFQSHPDSKYHCKDIEKMVVTKLRQQCNVTQMYLSNILKWDDTIAIKVSNSTIRKKFPEIALPYLRKTTLERQIVNHDELIKKIKDYIKDPPSNNKVIIAWSESRGESDIEHIVSWLVATCECCEEITLDCLDFDPCKSIKQEIIQSKINSLLIKKPNKQILVISNLQYAEQDIQRNLWNNWCPKVKNENGGNLVIIFAEGNIIPSDHLEDNKDNILEFTNVRIKDHLLNKCGYSNNRANELASPISCLQPRKVIEEINGLYNGWVTQWI